ncbi:2-C-methyl-D-erythritol 4-phosphate cytidylyltransferase [Aquiflexum sp. LQ15W]|uniref:2-C-methyl-D-erythritol 4-phosphate cytidylyltransferase n=1 Tax=Cognataquiflexum nitidum TaxID=2922272 RepID=UPI001F1312F0|nr:2-C-methyl-D-erythritol 4-phosphate cytidylyltransferase [Cognataquiflexum nitidum]MCH6198724.1 2-C-methyl-D-erythritol 4-phosphate cytidylyltransferase [Cognataquiflexum nitidum]
MNKFAIIVAGGSGTRMGASISKQYLEIGGKPILMHTLEVFFKTLPDIRLILVIPEKDFGFWGDLCSQYQFDIPHAVINGGNSRFQSVKNGLDTILSEDGLVAIHDGVRPFVNPQVIIDSFEVAEKSGSAIAVVALKDSLRKLTDDGKSFFQERQNFRLVQTPQTFMLSKIKKAFDVTELYHFTDDATVYEHQGWQVELISGNPENIKITSPDDMVYADFLISRRNS